MSRSASRLVVFDCDGTLVDSQHTILAAMTAAFAENGIAPPPAARVRGVIGLSLDTAIARLAPTDGPEAWPALAEGYKRAFRALVARPEHDDPLYPGVVETLDRLEREGAALAIATGKGLPGLRATLGRHGLLRRFASLQTADRARGKPDPEMLLNAMAETGAERAATAMVGDTVHDMQMAANARVLAVGASWGYGTADELRAAGAAIVIDAMSDLPVALAGLAGEGPA